MKKNLILFLLFYSLSLLFSIDIPYSNVEIKTPENCLGDLLRVDPDDEKVCEYQTDIYLWYDRDNLYALFEAELNEDFEKGTFAMGESFPEADFLRLQVITIPNNYFGYCFYAWPLENHYDCVRNQDLNMESSWDSDYTYTNEFTETHWRCVMTIPFKDLRYDNSAIKNWKVIGSRRLKEKDEYYSIPFVTTEMGKDYYRKSFDITLTEPIAKNYNTKIRPYYVQKYDKQDDRLSKPKENVGLDFSFNPTTSTKVKVSLNPDFSDVPMDEETDNFNMRYAPWFMESRFFFTEDIDVFGVNDELFYTRNLMQPIYAAKITGSGENYTFGVLAAKDKEVKDSNGYITNADDYYNLIAYKFSNHKYSLQTTLLNSFNNHFFSEVLHLSSNYDFNDENNLYLSLDSSYYGEDFTNDKKGYEISTGYSFDYKDFSANTSLNRRSKNFESKMGRIFETDYTNSNQYFGYNKDLNESKILNAFGISSWTNYSIHNEKNEFSSNNIGVNFWFNFEFDMNIWVNANGGKFLHTDDWYDYEKLYHWNSYSMGTRYYKFKPFNFGFNLSQSKDLYFRRLKQYKKRSMGINIWGDLGSHFSYSFNVNQTEYLNFEKDFSQDYHTENNEVFTLDNLADNKYIIGNISAEITLSNNLSCKSGLGFNNYENLYNGNTGHVGFYSNLKWEFIEDYFLYLGYSTAADEVDDNGILDDSRILNHEQLYMKLVLTL